MLATNHRKYLSTPSASDSSLSTRINIENGCFQPKSLKKKNFDSENKKGRGEHTEGLRDGRIRTLRDKVPHGKARVTGFAAPKGSPFKVMR